MLGSPKKSNIPRDKGTKRGNNLMELSKNRNGGGGTTKKEGQGWRWEEACSHCLTAGRSEKPRLPSLLASWPPPGATHRMNLKEAEGQEILDMRSIKTQSRMKKGRTEVGVGMENNQHKPIIPFPRIHPRDVIKDGSKESYDSMFFHS